MKSFSIEAILSLKDKMTPGLQRAAGATQTLGQKFRSAIGLGSAMGIAMKGVNAATNMLTSSVGAAVQRYDQLNNFPKMMTNLGIAAKDTNAAIKVLNKGLEGIPTTMQQATAGVTRFTSKNGDIKKSTQYFLALNNALLAGGQPMEQQATAMEQLSQAYAKGKPDMMEWRSLMNAMPAQLNMVAKAMGMTTDALGEGLRNGTISMDDFMDTIVRLNTEGIDGMASFEKQAKTSCAGIGTAVTNLKTNVVKGVANVIGGIDAGLQKAGFPTIGEAINKLTGKVKGLSEAAGEAASKINFKGIVAGAGPYIKDLISLLGYLGKGFGEVAKFANKHAEGFTTLIPILYIASKAYKQLRKVRITPSGGIPETDKLKDAQERLIDSTARLNNGLASLAKNAGFALIIGSVALLALSLSKLGEMGNKAVAPLLAFGVVVAGLAAVFELTGKSLQTNMTGIVAFSASVSAMALSMSKVASTGTQGAIAMATFGIVVAGLAAVFSTLAPALDAGAIGILAFGAAVALCGVGLGQAAPLVEALTGLMPALGDAALSVGQAFATVIDAISGGFVNVLNAVASVIESVGVSARNAGIGFNLTAAGISAISSLSIGSIAKSLAAVATGLALISSKGQNLPAIGNAMMVLLVASSGASVNMAMLAASMQSLNSSVAGTVTGVYQLGAAFNGLSSGAGVAVAAVSVMVVSMMAALAPLPGRFGNVGIAAGLQLSSGLTSGMSKAISVSHAGVAQINSTLAGASKGSFLCGVNIGQGLANGMRASLGEVRSVAAQLAEAAEKAIRAKAQIHSPSRVTTKLGKYFTKGWTNSIKDGVSTAKKWASALVDIPNVGQNELALSFGSLQGEIGDDFYTGDGGTYVIEVPVNLDGKLISKIVAPFMKKDISKLENRESRKRGDK